MTLRIFNDLKRIKSELMNVQSLLSIVKKKASFDKVNMITSRFFNSQLFVSFKLLILEIKAYGQQVIFNIKKIIKKNVEKLS